MEVLCAPAVEAGCEDPRHLGDFFSALESNILEEELPLFQSVELIGLLLETSPA